MRASNEVLSKDFPQGASEWPKAKVLDFLLYLIKSEFFGTFSFNPISTDVFFDAYIPGDGIFATPRKGYQKIILSGQDSYLSHLVQRRR